MKTTLKIGLPSKIFFCPLPLKDYLKFFLMTSHYDSHTTTDVKLEIILGVSPGNGIPHDNYNICGIAHARTNRKDDISMQRRLGQIFICIFEWGKGLCTARALLQPSLS